MEFSRNQRWQLQGRSQGANIAVTRLFRTEDYDNEEQFIEDLRAFFKENSQFLEERYGDGNED